MKVTFLGTGGGRFLILKQLRYSGGWILEAEGEMLSVDPGPGALIRAGQFKVPLRRLTGVLVSHGHPDHYTDAEMMIEGMTSGATRKRGVVVGSEHAIKGGEDYRPAISPYHLKAVDRVEVLKPGDEVELGELSVKATPTKHRDPGCVGFVFQGKETLGYTSDTEYFSGLEKHFRGCDYFILNVLRPRKAPWPMHMNSEGAAKLIGKVKPKLAVIQHFGMKMVWASPEKEARWIEEQSGVRTLAAKDGLRLDFAKEAGKPGVGLGKWVK